MKNKLLLLIAGLFVVLFSAFTSDKTITIFMIGDSTMANKPLEGDNQERGWGQVLGGFFSEEIVIDNHAKNGRSSKSFIDEGRWDVVLRKMKPGDYVFIQFGHNDEKANPDRHTDPGTTFDANLKRFVSETRAKGGIPVLFNSIVRRNFRVNENAVAEDDYRKIKLTELPEGDVLIDTHGEYLNSPRNVAKEMDVPFVDMNKLTHDLVQDMGPEASKKLYMWMPANKFASCPQGRQDNTHLSVYGARTITRMTVEAIAEVVPALKPYVRYYDFVVAKDGSGDFFTLQDAIDAVPDFRKEKRTNILVRRGVYKEKLIVPECKLNISLIGEDGAVLTNDDYAQKKNRFGENMSTSGSSTCYIYGPDFYAENITFENSAGRVGQAVACFIEGDRAYFKNCRFLGNQDTLYNYGKESRQYFEKCYIEGTVDFIFGWATVLFKDCVIHSVGDGYVTAPATDKGKKYGYVFMDCKLTAADGVSKVYLSRPWRPYAKAVFIRCDLGNHIMPEGWNNWGKKDNEKTAYYAEYKNIGEGAPIENRAKWSHQLKNLNNFGEEDILLGNDGWNPVKNGNELLKDLKR